MERAFWQSVNVQTESNVAEIDGWRGVRAVRSIAIMLLGYYTGEPGMRSSVGAGPVLTGVA